MTDKCLCLDKFIVIELFNNLENSIVILFGKFISHCFIFCDSLSQDQNISFRF